ncbi:hypothetical protein [Chromatium okenii]|nr:hypothetical protein [Chromatium okenii]
MPFIALPCPPNAVRWLVTVFEPKGGAGAENALLKCGQRIEISAF